MFSCQYQWGTVRSFHRENVLQSPLTWDQVARTWEGHWDWCFAGKPAHGRTMLGGFSECGGAWLPLAEGLHCS